MTKLTHAEIQAAREALVEEGLLVDSGRRKLNPHTGEQDIVWELAAIKLGIYRNGKPYGTIIDEDAMNTMTREQLIEVFNSATSYIVKLHNGGYDIIDIDDIDDGGEFSFKASGGDAKNG